MILAMYVGRDRDQPSQIHVSSGEFQYLSSLEMSKEYHLSFLLLEFQKKLSSTKNSWGTPISTSLTGAYTDAEEPRNYHSQSRRLLEVEEP